MRVIHIVPGSGGTFYCQNCLRDCALVLALRELGHDVVVAPMYLPVLTDDRQALGEGPVFYGAINTYLREKLPWFRRAPLWLRRCLDAPAILRWAARRSGTTRARGLEEMTVSVLRGEEGNQAQALDGLVRWLEVEERPDLIHISNALLLGLVPRIRQSLGIPVICSLQDEDSWVETMRADAIAGVWRKMRDLASGISLFMAPSRHYAEKMKRRLGLPDERVRVIPLGIEVDRYAPAMNSPWPPTIGFLSKMSPQFGLDVLLDAFLILKQEVCFRELRLRATGGMTRDVRGFLAGVRKRLRARRLEGEVDLLDGFGQADRVRFLQTLTVLSVPVPGGEAFGMFQLEAMACGVPVVQPEEGAFPEIVRSTGGGVLYAPNDARTLAATLRELLLDEERRRRLGESGRTAVCSRHSMARMARLVVDAYVEVGELGGRP